MSSSMGECQRREAVLICVKCWVRMEAKKKENTDRVYKCDTGKVHVVLGVFFDNLRVVD